MRLLLDTHIAIWAALEPDVLTVAERRLIANAASRPVLSAVSVWELRLKWDSYHVSGARKGRAPPGSIVAFADAVGWTKLPLTASHAAAALLHPLAHKDPFDELLVAQAQEEGMQLLTRDTRLIRHPIAATVQ